MPKQVLVKGYTLINGQDLSDHCHTITFGQGADAVEMTSMGDTTHNFLPGLLNPTLSLEHFQDYSADSVDATLAAILAAGVPVSIQVRPSSDAVGAANPSYTGDWVLESYDAISGTVGQANMSKSTWKPAGNIVRATS